MDIDDILEPSVAGEFDLLQDDINRQLYQILSYLTNSERDFLALRYQSGLSNEEIGKILGIQAKAVSERYRRLLKKCRDIAITHGIKEDTE